MKPTFSVIIPTFNRGYILWKTIQSVQRQIYPNWELLIIDDGSTDNTEQVVAEFQKDPRIVYVKQKNMGDNTARNKGIELSKGDYLTYVDSDDILFENYLSTTLEFFTKFPNKSFAVSNYNRRIELYDETYKLVDFTESSSAQKIDVTLQDFYHWKVKTCGTGIFHKRTLLDSGIRWDPEVKVLQDLDLINGLYAQPQLCRGGD